MHHGGCDNAPVAPHDMDGHSGMEAISAELIAVNMGQFVAHDFIQWLRLGFDGDLISHRTGRTKEGGFMTEHGGHFFF